MTWNDSIAYDYRDDLDVTLDKLEVLTGYRIDASNVAANQSFLEWCEDLSEKGMKVDGFPFTLANRPAMRFIYGLIPTTLDEAFGKITVIMKCAQVGFTIFEMLASVYMAIKFSPCRVGLYLPDMKLAAAKSTERFMPIIRSIPAVYKQLTVDADGHKRGEGNVMIRSMGDSRFHFLWTSGESMTESFPIDFLSFDEVQNMSIGDMEKTRERLSASRVRFTLMGSTANVDGQDIHFWYKRGTQYQFHTECPSCGVMQVLDDNFPNCIRYDEDQREYFYACKDCRGYITDPQRGQWIAKNPESRIISVHFPQMLSPTISPREVIEAYNNADDMKNFYNRKLGKPFNDPSQMPISLELLNELARLGMERGLEWKKRAVNTFLGLDQMGSFIVAVVLERLTTGHTAVIHLEYIYTAPTPAQPNISPWDRCDELMLQYGVQVCCVETLPNYDSAKSFARRHHGKVFLAGYAQMNDEMLRWGDAQRIDGSERKTDRDARDRYTVTLDQYKVMSWALAKMTKRLVLFPDPMGLVQEILDKGMRRMSPVCKELAFLHFTKVALIAEQDEEQKKFIRKVVKVGIDPHTAYAYYLGCTAMARAYGTGQFILPQGPPDHEEKRAEAAKREMPGLPSGVTQMILSGAEKRAAVAGGEVCGNCEAFEAATGRCKARNFTVTAQMPGCDIFVAAQS